MREEFKPKEAVKKGSNKVFKNLIKAGVVAVALAGANSQLQDHFKNNRVLRVQEQQRDTVVSYQPFEVEVGYNRTKIRVQIEIVISKADYEKLEDYKEHPGAKSLAMKNVKAPFGFRTKEDVIDNPDTQEEIKDQIRRNLAIAPGITVRQVIIKNLSKIE